MTKYFIKDVKSVDLAVLGSVVLQSQECTTDYIVIPSPMQVVNGMRTALPSDRFCGLGIGDTISKLNLGILKQLFKQLYF